MNDIAAGSLTLSNEIRRVLLIDEIENSLGDLLAQSGYEVCHADDCQGAIQMVRDCRPALVLLDISGLKYRWA